MEALKIGTAGPAVLEIQSLLNNNLCMKEYKLEVDGQFGPMTEKAIKKFQENHGFPQTGILDAKTEADLRYYQFPKSAKAPTLPDVVPHPNAKLFSLEWYADLWDRAIILLQYETSARAAFVKVQAGHVNYSSVEAMTGVPAWILGPIHWREASCNFKCYLGNGQPLNMVTTIVPKGRGPFLTWGAGAVDALTLQKSTEPSVWTIETALKYAHQYNGLGVEMYHSPQISGYLGAYTNLTMKTGAYTADGHYDSKADAHAYSGVIAILKCLQESGFKFTRSVL